MADKKLYYDKIYGLVMQCRKSGLSDKQWCINNAIAQVHFIGGLKSSDNRPAMRYRNTVSSVTLI